MKHQRGMVLLTALILSLLLGLLAAAALREAVLQTRMAGLLLASSQALEQAEAVLLEGAARLAVAPPNECQPCSPPADSHDVNAAGGDWQGAGQGWFNLQNLGQSDRAAHLPVGTQATLYRVTAVSQQTRARHVLEAVYAQPVDPSQAPQRILWRQRVQEP